MNTIEIEPYRPILVLPRRARTIRSELRVALRGMLLVVLIACAPPLALASSLTPEQIAQLQDLGFQDTLRENLDPNYDLSTVTKEQFNEDIRLVTLILSGVVDTLKEKIDPNYDIRKVSPEQLRNDLKQLILIEAGLTDAVNSLFDPNTDFTDISFQEFQQQIDDLDNVTPGGGGGGDGGGTVVTPLPTAFWLFVSAIAGLACKRRKLAGSALRS